MIEDDRSLSQGKQQNPDTETQDTQGPRETTLPSPEKDGPEGLRRGWGGGGVTDKTGNEKSEDGNGVHPVSSSGKHRLTLPSHPLPSSTEKPND